MSQGFRGTKTKSKTSHFFGQDVQILSTDLVPPTPLTKPIDFNEELRFLVLDVDGRDTDYTHWISPDTTTDKTILELYLFLYMLNRVFYHAEQKCCVFVQQKERLVPGNLLVRKEIVTGHLLYFGFDWQVLEDVLPTCVILALMINTHHFDARRLFVSPLSLDALKAETWRFDPVKGVADSVAGMGAYKTAQASGVFGWYKTLHELGQRLLSYHRVSQTDANDVEMSGEEGGCRYHQLRRTMLQLLHTDDVNEFATGLMTLLSPPFLFENSFRMARSYREMRDLIAINGHDLGLDADRKSVV